LLLRRTCIPRRRPFGRAAPQAGPRTLAAAGRRRGAESADCMTRGPRTGIARLR